MANANFTPDIGPYTTLKPFRFWCQKVLPLVYDDSLSYYELLGKVVDYLNKTMEDVDTQITDIQGLLSAYEALQGWVNHYYDSADFAADIDAGLDRMAESGQLTTLLTAIVNPELPSLVDDLLPEVVLTLLPDEVSSQIPGAVATQLPGVVSNQIGGTVATQLPGVVSNQIGGTVANQLPAVVSNQIGPVVEDKIVDPVEDWLDANVSGGIAVDRTLSVLGAGADAAFTGARLKTLDDTLGYEHVADTGSFITTPNPYAFNYEVINENADFSDLASHTYKMIVIPVTTGDKYCINAHKISIANVSENHFAVTYAFCAKHIGDPQTDIPYYLPTTYSTDDAENAIATVPEIVIPTGQYYDETTGYLVVITANIEDPVYKVTGSDFATVDYVDDEIDAVNEAVEGVAEDLTGKADVDGTYPYLTAGTAQQLASDQVVTDQKPYLFRKTGADATSEYDTLVGGSVVSNQIVDSNDTAVTLTSGRKYYTVISGTVAIQAGTGAPISVTGGSDMVIDITQMFGSAIADYAYTLEQATAGAGIAWLKSYGFFSGYQTYNAGSMVHVSGVSAHIMRDADDNIIGNYPLDSSLTLRGIPKLADGQLYYDGDVYAHDGTVTRRYKLMVINEDADINTGSSGMSFRIANISDKKQLTGFNDDPNAISDMLIGTKQSSTWGIPFTFSFTANSDTMFFNLAENITTISDAKAYLSEHPITLLYELGTPTTETAAPYQSPQICDPDGTEQYITDGIPVGHTTDYPANLKGEIERVMVQVPAAPTAAGTYVLTCTVDSSGSASYEWAASTGRALGAIRPADQIQDQIREPAADPGEIQEEIREPEADQETDPDDIQDTAADPE